MKAKPILAAILVLAAMVIPAMAGNSMAPIQLSGSFSRLAMEQPFAWMPSGQMVSIFPGEAAPMYAIPWSLSSHTREPIQLSGAKFSDSRYSFSRSVGWGTFFGGGGTSTGAVGWLSGVV